MSDNPLDALEAYLQDQLGINLTKMQVMALAESGIIDWTAVPTYDSDSDDDEEPRTDGGRTYEYTVELHVTGTFRDELLAGDADEAERWAKRHATDKLGPHFADWEWEVVATRNRSTGEVE